MTGENKYFTHIKNDTKFYAYFRHFSPENSFTKKMLRNVYFFFD